MFTVERPRKKRKPNEQGSMKPARPYLAASEASGSHAVNADYKGPAGQSPIKDHFLSSLDIARSVSRPNVILSTKRGTSLTVPSALT